MSLLELETYKLVKFFLKFYKSHTFKYTTVRNSKWWDYFYRAAEKYSNEPGWNPYAFIAAQFEKYDQILPYHLTKKIAYDAYIEYKSRFEEDNDKNLVLSLLSSYNLVKEWCHENGYGKINFKAFFRNTDNIEKLRRRNTNHDLFSIIKSFRELNSKENIYSEEEIDNSRRKILTKNKILNKMKEVLKEEFV